MFLQYLVSSQISSELIRCNNPKFLAKPLLSRVRGHGVGGTCLVQALKAYTNCAIVPFAEAAAIVLHLQVESSTI